MDPLKPTLCPQCRTLPGKAHAPRCSVRQCASCGHWNGEHFPKCAGSTSSLPWSGFWPGAMECREFGWITPGDAPSEDLNRLVVAVFDGVAKWDKDQARFVKG